MNGTANGKLRPELHDALTAEAEKKTLKVAIIGKAPSSRMLAPYDDDSWEIWGLSNCYSFCPRVSRSFELHDLEEGAKRWDDGYKTWLASQHKFPLYVQRESLLAPHAVPFPRERCEREAQRFSPPGHRPYINNSVSWMILLAIAEGATEIGLFGVDMAQHGKNLKSEYAHQRPSCEFWLGVAAGLGIKISVPEQSDLLKISKLYGFETHGAMRTKLDARYKELVDRKRKAEQAIEQAQQQVLILHGAIEDLEYVGQWVGEDGFAK